MAQPASVAHTGVLSGTPSNPPGGLQEIGNTSFNRTYSQRMGGAPSIINATEGVPFVIPLGTVTKIRMFWMRVIGGTLKVKVTSAAGTDQAFNVSDEVLWHSPFEGDQWTAVKIVGTADIEYVIFGD